MPPLKLSEEDIREAAELFDAEISARGLATFTPEQIREFQSVAAEPDVIERARRSHELGLRVLREAEESQRRYEQVLRDAEAVGLDLNPELDGDAARARERATAEYLERARREVEQDVRRYFPANSDSAEEETTARAWNRGAGRFRV